MGHPRHLEEWDAATLQVFVLAVWHVLKAHRQRRLRLSLSRDATLFTAFGHATQENGFLLMHREHQQSQL